MARYGKHKAYGVAVGMVKKWAKGIHPGGKRGKGGKQGHVHPDVQAAAAKNVAQWEEDKAKAHAQSREHEHVKATASLSLRRQSRPGSRTRSPARRRSRCPRCRAARLPKTMYTAHRINNLLLYLAHAAERLVQAKQGKALRGYHMMHVNNHLGHALDEAHDLVTSCGRTTRPRPGSWMP